MRKWSVTCLEPNDRGNLAAGFISVALDQPSEADARQVFDDKIRVAESLGYASIQLRCDGAVVATWPIATGDEPDYSDMRRAAALISHRAASHHEGLHWSLAEAAEAGTLSQLLRAVDAVYRVTIDYFGADAQAIDGHIQEFSTAEAADDFEVYNRHAAQAIMAIREEDRVALNAVFDAVNGDAAGPRLVGGVCDVYAGLLPVLVTPDGQEFLSAFTARLAAVEEQSS